MRDERMEQLRSRVTEAASGMQLLWPETPTKHGDGYRFNALFESKKEEPSVDGSWYYRGVKVSRVFIFKPSDSVEAIREALKEGMLSAITDVLLVAADARALFV